jgi:dihydrofolate reductase
MRKVIAEIAVSVDGLIEGPGGELDWLNFEEETRYANGFLAGIDTIFYGRKTYEKFGLPRPTDDSVPQDEREFNETINSMRKYVFSRTVKHVAGSGMVIGSNLLEEVNRIKDEDGKDIWLCGGQQIIRVFTGLDLIDEYMLAVQPSILGSGKPLFTDFGQLKLRLLQTRKLTSGVIVLHYLPERKNLTTSLL